MITKVKCALCGGAGWVDCGVNAAYVLAGLSDDCPRCDGSGEEPKRKAIEKNTQDLRTHPIS